MNLRGTEPAGRREAEKRPGLPVSQVGHARRRKPTGELASLEKLVWRSCGDRAPVCARVFHLDGEVEGQAGRVGIDMTLKYSYDE